MMSTVCKCLSRLFIARERNLVGLSSLSQMKNMSSVTQDDVIFEEHDDKGVILLNRPKQLNAYHMDMIKKISHQLRTWENNDKKLVIIKAASRGFCAGGDIKILASNRGSSLVMNSTKEEYQINNLIASLSIPYVALIDGIVMGGGNGLSTHGSFRIVTENAVFAMPECSIGFFPDVGATYFLPRLTEKVGLYLALTGARLVGYDMYKVGLATHYVCSERLDQLEQSLLQLPNPDFKKVDDFLTAFQEQWDEDFKQKKSLIEDRVGRIYNSFENSSSVENILENLHKDNSQWAKEQLATLSRMSPTSLKVTFQSQKLGSKMSLPDCLRLEYIMAYNMFNHNDFFEGVRALLIDKDHNPRWQPSSLKEVSEQRVNSFFSAPPELPELSF